MALILSLETSTKVCSVALHKNDELLTTGEIHIAQSHASKLAPLIEKAIHLASAKVSEIKAVAVSAGPGSYTGLRIGTSTAKGLCFAMGVPLIAVNTLDLLAFQMSRVVTTDTLLCPMIDARRMEVYCKLFDRQLTEIHPIEALEIQGDSFSEILKTRQIIFFGDGAGKCQAIIRHPNALFIDSIYPMASYLGFMAAQKLKNNQVEDLERFEPFYLKEFLIKQGASDVPSPIKMHER
jgi:tRNA threonylcarbamoyladenosine biosynthesis protein TsaB